MPPWVIGASSRSRPSPRRSPGPARSRAPATSRRRSRRACRSAGCCAPCRRTGTPSAGPGRSGSRAASGSRRRTSTPSTYTSPAVTSKSRGTRLTSVVLPAPVEPMIAVVCPGGAVNDEVAQHRRVGAGVGELDAAELQLAAPVELGDRLGGRDDGRLGVEHLGDPVGAHRGARHHHQHEGRHHHRHQDLHEVGQEGRQGTDLHLAGVDAVAAEPEHGDAGHVQDQHHRREHRGHPATGAHRDVGEVVVGGGEPLGSRRARGRRRGPRGCR